MVIYRWYFSSLTGKKSMSTMVVTIFFVKLHIYFFLVCYFVCFRAAGLLLLCHVCSYDIYSILFYDYRVL